MPLTYVVTGKIALDKLSTKISQNLTRMFANLVGFLVEEHNQDGTHGNIHADSITITANTETGATGDLTLDGDIHIAGNILGDRFELANDELHLGTGGLSSSTVLGGLVIAKDVVAPSVSWAIVSAVDALDDHFGIYDVTHDEEVVKIYRVDGGPEYLFARDGTNALSPVYFGGGGIFGYDNDQLWDDIAGKHLYSRGNADVEGDLVLSATFGSGVIYEQGRTNPMGVGTNVAFNAANFTASSGTWTVAVGDQLQLRYRQVGALVFVSFNLATTDVSATPTELRIAVPITPVSGGIGFCDLNDNGTRRVGICNGSTAGYIQIQRADGGTFAAAAGTTGVRGTCLYEI